MDTIYSILERNSPAEQPLRAHTRMMHYKKGEMILQAHQVSDHVHIIQSGFVKVFHINNSGVEAIISLYSRNDIFPLAWMVNGRRKNAFFQAITDCTIVLLPNATLMNLMTDSSVIALAMSQRIIEQYENYSVKLDNLEYRFTRERLAYRLLLLANRFGRSVDGVLVIMRFSQNDLAAMINTSRESLSREMSRFERRGIIKYTSRHIIIQSPIELRKELGKDVQIFFYDN